MYLMKYLFDRSYAVLAIFLILISLAGCRDSESRAQPEESRNQVKAVRVSVVKVTPVPIHDILVLPGETEAWQDIVVAADTSGRVEWIGTREGTTVKKGELLAMFDVSALKAALDRAQAALKLADDLYKRRQQLFESKIITREELDRSLTEQTLANASFQQAQVEHERGFLRSPISGVINHLFVDEGEFIERGKAVADLVNVDKIKINVNIPELDVRYLSVGQKTKVKIDAFPDRPLSGNIDFVAYKADVTTKTFRVKVLINNPQHAIRPGMIARVAFLRRTIPDALVAPLFALVDKGGERILFVEKDGKAHARTVSIGVIEGDRVQITNGLNLGDNLIVTGQTEVEEGMRVQFQ
jgi:membrane fusion protein (multidrug efflux system)